MNRAIKFSLILISLTIGLAGAGYANIIVDGNVNTLDVNFPGLTATQTTHGDWHVSAPNPPANNKAVGVQATNGTFSNFSSGNWEILVTPDLNTAGNTHFAANGSYTVTVDFTNTTRVSLAILVNGTVVQSNVTSGSDVTFNVTNFATSNIQFEFTGNGTATLQPFTLQTVNLVANGPEPKSVGAAVLLIGLVGCTERRRLGGLMTWISGRWARLFS